VGTLAQALTKLDAYNKTLPLDVNLAEAALFVVDPLAKHGWSSWASVQPSIEDRVRNLVGRYPL
jgi:heat shock protein HtpX